MQYLLLALLLAAPDVPTDPALLAKLSVSLQLQLREPHRRQARSAMRLFVARFETELTDGRVRELEGQGIAFERHGSRLTHVGPFYGVRVTDRGWEALLAAPELRRVISAVPRRVRPSPLPSAYDHVEELTHSRDVSSRRDASGDRILGQGVTIADMDSGVDPFHPLLFEPDGGYYPWTDVDGDGAFDAGIDGVDLDEDGTIATSELLRPFGGAIVDWDGSLTDVPQGFEPGRQWLFADLDGDGWRDYGPGAGFVEADPAYGEPLFLADDVDRNGELDAGEKIVRLATPKVRNVIRTWSGEYYVRGQNLIDAPVHDNVDHGTAVSSILVGGSYGLTQVLGVAPQATLLMIDHSWGAGDPDQPAQTEIWAIDIAKLYGAQIMLHEYGDHAHQYADGSDAREELIDQLTSDGVVQTTACHNFAGVNGNSISTLAASASRDLPFSAWNLDGLLRRVYVTVRWRDGSAGDLAGTIITPANVEIPMTNDGQNGQYFAYSSSSQSPRGTSMLASVVFEWDGFDYQSLDDGQWRIRLQNLTASSRQVHVTIGDGVTGYAYYVDLIQNVTDDTTIAWPSTADTALSVGATSGNFQEAWEVEGSLKYFSGRGPRIDGLRGVDVVAPEDDYAAVRSGLAGHGHYQVFGGTSGALPQVAGAIALLLQLEPHLEPLAVKGRVLGRAVGDAITGTTPNPQFGFGHLDTHRLLFNVPAQVADPPVVQVTAPAQGWTDELLTLDASGSTSAGYGPAELTFRWDIDYDGVWDSTAVGDGATVVSFPTPGSYRLKLEVENPLGLATQQLVAITIDAAPEPDGGPQAGDGDPTGGDGDEWVPGGCGCHGVPPGLIGPGLLILLGGWRLRRRLKARR